MCKFCDRPLCYAHCQDTPSGQHEVDTTTADSSESAKSGTPDANGELVVEFNCKHCGQYGAVRVKVRDIGWA